MGEFTLDEGTATRLHNGDVGLTPVLQIAGACGPDASETTTGGEMKRKSQTRFPLRVATPPEECARARREPRRLHPPATNEALRSTHARLASRLHLSRPQIFAR